MGITIISGSSGDMTKAVYDADLDGTIDAGAGGLELDISESTGILKVTSGTVSAITDGSTNWNTAYTHSQIAGGNSVHVSTTENTNWDTAYTHSTASSGNPHSVSKSDVGLGSVENTAISTWAGTSNITTVGTLSAGNVDAAVTAASASGAGIVELATTAETNTGTDATRAVTPDGLAGSVLGTKTVILKVMAEATVVTSGDGKMYFTVPIELNGMNLVSVGAHVYTVDAANAITVDIYNFTDSQDMLSTALTIDANENDSATAATAAAINASYDDVATADVIRIDVTTYAGAVAAGLEVRLGFRLP